MHAHDANDVPIDPAMDAPTVATVAWGNPLADIAATKYDAADVAPRSSAVVTINVAGHADRPVDDAVTDRKVVSSRTKQPRQQWRRTKAHCCTTLCSFVAFSFMAAALSVTLSPHDGYGIYAASFTDANTGYFRWEMEFGSFNDLVCRGANATKCKGYRYPTGGWGNNENPFKLPPITNPNPDRMDLGTHEFVANVLFANWCLGLAACGMFFIAFLMSFSTSPRYDAAQAALLMFTTATVIFVVWNFAAVFEMLLFGTCKFCGAVKAANPKTILSCEEHFSGSFAFLCVAAAAGIVSTLATILRSASMKLTLIFPRPSNEPVDEDPEESDPVEVAA